MNGNQELNPLEDMQVEISRSVLDLILEVWLEISRKPLILEVRKPEIWPWGSPPKESADQRVEALGIRHPKRPFMLLLVRTRRASAIQLMGRPKEMDSPSSRTVPAVQEMVEFGP